MQTSRHRLFAAILAFALTLTASAVPAMRVDASVTYRANLEVSGDLQLFSTEAAAQQHCPRDIVVWLNTKTGVYHEKGMRWYGRTRQGAYVCKGEADAAGDRDTRNGQ